IAGVIVNGNGGNDTLTFDVSNLLTTANFVTPLPIAFNNTLGLNTLKIVSLSDTSGSNLTETFSLGDVATPNQLIISTGSRNTATNLIIFTALPSATAINDSLVGTDFVFNGNGANNMAAIQNQGPNNVVITGLNNQAMMNFASGPGSGDFRAQSASRGNGN